MCGDDCQEPSHSRADDRPGRRDEEGRVFDRVPQIRKRRAQLPDQPVASSTSLPGPPGFGRRGLFCFQAVTALAVIPHLRRLDLECRGCRNGSGKGCRPRLSNVWWPSDSLQSTGCCASSGGTAFSESGAAWSLGLRGRRSLLPGGRITDTRTGSSVPHGGRRRRTGGTLAIRTRNIPGKHCPSHTLHRNSQARDESHRMAPAVLRAMLRA